MSFAFSKSVIDYIKLSKIMQPANAINEVFSICQNQLLGKGSTGNVYLGFYNGQPDRRVAIKQIDLTSINNEVTQYLLSCEIAALSNLGKLQNTAHENIVKLIDIVMNHNTMYLVLQLLEGGTLAQHIKKHPQGLPVDEAMHIFRQILEGYQRIKNKQIIHRDLKPDNILFKHQQGRTIAIIDFGYCTMQQVPNKPQVFYNVGSPKYMSPQAYKQNKYSEKSDIWAIGVMLYEMLVGHTCDKGLSMEAYLDMLQRQGVPIPQKINGFQHFLLANMLSYNQHHRFDCDHILNELRTNAGGELPRNKNIIQIPGSPLQQNRIHSQQLQINSQPNQHVIRVQNVQMNQNSPGDLAGRQNSLLNLRNTLNDADLIALRANRHQPLFHSVMLPEEHPLFKIDRNSVPERGLRSESKINDQNQNTPAQSNQRVISFHVQAEKKLREDAAPILGRVQNVDLNSVRQIVHRRHPDWMFQSKINNQSNPQAMTKQSTIVPLHPQELRQQLIGAHSQYINGSKAIYPNEQQPIIVQQIRPQKVNNQIKSAHILISPTPRNDQANNPHGQRVEQSPFFSINSCTPKAGQPQSLQMSVYHPSISQNHQQNGQIGSRALQSATLQREAERPNFKKIPSSGQLMINLSQKQQGHQEPFSNRSPFEVRTRAINKDLTATRIPEAQRFSHKDQPQQRSINPQIRNIPNNHQQQILGKVLNMRPQTQSGRNFTQINSNSARFDVIPIHHQPQLTVVRQAIIK